MLNIKRIVVNPLQENCYLLWNEAGNGVILDPGCIDEAERDRLATCFLRERITPKEIWLTHGHFDHIFGVAALVREHSLTVRMAPEDRETLRANLQLTRQFGLPAPDGEFACEPLSDGQRLAFPGSPAEPVFQVIATPGHTPGGVCFYDAADKVLFSGDTLFAGSIGRTDHPGGDYDKLIVSIMDKLMGLPGDVDVLPGHGPRTSIGRERTRNPFLEPFNEPEEEGMGNG